MFVFNAMGAQRKVTLPNLGVLTGIQVRVMPVKILKQYHSYLKDFRNSLLKLHLESDSCSFEFVQHKKTFFLWKYPKVACSQALRIR